MSIRNLLTNSALNTELTTSLKNNDNFIYAHLIKFERPKPGSFQGNISKAAKDYSYITDSPYNLKFDDGSVDSLENANGQQTYVANKVMSIGAVSETITAKASNLTINIDGNALGTSITETFTFTSLSCTCSVDLVDAGYQEGDVVVFTASGASNTGLKARFDKFSNDNKTVLLTPISGTLTADSTATTYTLSMEISEIQGLLSDRASDTGTYINREVIIYRAHIEPTTGNIIGAPFLLFKGIITKGSISENVLNKTTVTWNLVSHWGDFLQVAGRLTSDTQHRALNSNGEPDVGALLRPEYAGDYGFLHADQSVNMVATYQDSVTKYKMKKRGGLAGFVGLERMVEYTEMVDRNVDLQFNLSSKYVPVVYGVQIVSGIPVFADCLNNNSNHLYTAHALCEGEISGILDVYIDGSSSICINESDFTARSSGEASVLCNGRADKGEVLATNTKSIDYAALLGLDDSDYDDYVETYGHIDEWTPAVFSDIGLDSNLVDLASTATNSSGGQGLQDLDGFSFTSPIPSRLVVHTGSSSQASDARLTQIADQQGFKIQNDFYTGLKSGYWGPSHRLLDTAYVTMSNTVGAGETTIPDLEYVVKGKLVECYNYDYSYVGTGTHTNFKLGDSVTLHNSSNDSLLGTVTIIDKWSFYNTQGTLEYRFRFSDNPQETLSVDEFYMKDSSNNKWFMAKSGTVVESLASARNLPEGTVSSAVAPDFFSVDITLSGPSAELESILSLTPNLNDDTDYVTQYVTISKNSTKVTAMVRSYNSSTNVLNVYAPNNKPTDIVNLGSGSTITLATHVKLASTASSVDNFYEGYGLEVITYDSDNNPTYLTQDVTHYDGASRIAVVANAYSATLDSTTKYKLLSPKGGDKRSTINPAMQLLDYMTSDRYGKNLDLATEIDLESFKQAARECETRSDVTVQVTGSTPSVGDEYEYAVSGRVIFRGKVKSVSPNVVSGVTYQEVTFEDCIGKLGYKWTSWRSFTTGDLVYYGGEAFLATSSGTITSTTISSYTKLSNLSLTKVGGSGSISVSISEGYTSSGNPIVKKLTSTDLGFTSSGYSLYDSDSCSYWVYLGWDEQEQRYVTRHQMNQTVDTSIPIFDNINSMLTQFNGMLRYSNGKYFLSIKQSIPTSFDSVEVMTADDIIGEVKVTDKGQKNTYNSITAQIIDPQNKFGGRSITFMNSEYLKQDKNVRRQGNFSMPGVSNYFNARINIEQYLDQSRFGNKVSFKIGQQAYLLLPGAIIKLSYPRFNWSNKYFRLENISFNKDGTANITATEHNDDAFLIKNITAKGSLGLPSQGNTNSVIFNTPGVPTALTAGDNKVGAIDVTWTNATDFDPDTHLTEVYMSDTNVRGDAVRVTNTVGNSYSYPVSGVALVTKYFWVRHAAYYDSKKYFSAYTAAESGSAKGSTFTQSVKLTSDTYVVSYTAEGNTPSPSGAQTLTATAQNLNDARYSFKKGTDAWTSIGSSNTTTFTPDSNYFGTPLTMQVRVYESTDTNTIVATDSITVSALKPGSIGVDGNSAISMILTNESHTLPKTDAGTLTLTGSGTTIRVFEGATELTYDAVGTSNSTYTVTKNLVNVAGGTVTAESGGDGAVVADYTGMSSTSGYVDFTVTGKTSNGTAVSFEKRQSLSQAVQGTTGSSVHTVKLTSDTYVVTYNKDGGAPSPSTAQTLTATAENFTNAEYRFNTAGSWSSWGSSNTTTFTPASAYFGTAKTMQVQVRESSDTSITATDAIDISAVKPGQTGVSGIDAITTIVTNEGHTLPTTTAGTITFTGSGTTFRVFEGDTELEGVLASTYDAYTGDQADGKYKITLTASSGLTAGAIGTESPGNGLVINDHTALTVDNATLTITVVGKRSDGTSLGSVSRTQSLAKANQGATGNNGYSAGLIILYRANTSSSTAPASPDNSVVYKPSTNTFTGSLDSWSVTKPELTVGQYLWAIQETYEVEQISSTTTVTIAAANWSTAVVVDSNTKGNTGDPGLRSVQGTLYYEKTTASAPSAPTGNTYTFSTGLVSGTNIGTGTDKWTNEPREMSATSDNDFYILRYNGTEAAANSTTIAVSYGTVSKHTSFDGVVTFTGGDFVKNGSTITTIDGGNINTDSIRADQLQVSNSTGAGAGIKMSAGLIEIFDSSGTRRIKLGDLS